MAQHAQLIAGARAALDARRRDVVAESLLALVTDLYNRLQAAEERLARLEPRPAQTGARLIAAAQESVDKANVEALARHGGGLGA